MPDLTIDPEDLPPREVYHLLTALVVPRPIAWVSTLGPGGVRNLAPHSYFNIASSDPPIIHVTSTGVKDTLTNARATGEFVVNVVGADLVEQMNLTATDFPPDEDEFTWARLESAPSSVVSAPRVAAAPAALECRVLQVLSIGNGNMVFGRVVAIHVAERVWADGRIDALRMAPVGRLSGSAYTPTTEVFKIPRRSWEDLRTEER